MQPTVIIETTIPSHYYETRADPTTRHRYDLTRHWWDHHAHRYSLVSSQAVIDELRLAPPAKAGKMLEFMRGVPLIPDPPGIGKIVDHYIRHRLVPSDVLGDAYHLAFASMHGLDFLLTWNCRHLANANKIRHIEVINRRLGLAAPVITTPEMLIPEENS